MGKFSTTVTQHDEKCSNLLQPRLSKIYNRQSLMKCILHKVRAIFSYLTTKVNPINVGFTIHDQSQPNMNSILYLRIKELV